MKKSERILNVALGLLMLAMFSGLCKQESEIERLTAEPPMLEVRIDTVWVHDTLFTGAPVMVKEVVREVPARVDTAAIVASFYTERTYSDTLHLLDVATVRITDTLLGNELTGRRVGYELATLQPVAVTERANMRGTRPCRLALTAGVQLGRGQAAVLAGMRYKRTELGGSYDLHLDAPSIFLKYDLWQWQ